MPHFCPKIQAEISCNVEVIEILLSAFYRVSQHFTFSIQSISKGFAGNFGFASHLKEHKDYMLPVRYKTLWYCILEVISDQLSSSAKDCWPLE